MLPRECPGSVDPPHLPSHVPAGDSCWGCCFPAPNSAACISLVPCVPCTSDRAGAGSGRAPAWGVGPAPNTALAVQTAVGIFWQQGSEAGVLPEKPHRGFIQSPSGQSVGWGLFTTPAGLSRLPKGHVQALELVFSPRPFSLFCSTCVSEQSLIPRPQFKGLSKQGFRQAVGHVPARPGQPTGCKYLVCGSWLQQVPAAGGFPRPSAETRRDDPAVQLLWIHTWSRHSSLGRAWL